MADTPDKPKQAMWRAAFTRARVGDEHHFVPMFARNRPACQRVLAGKHYEPDTHALVHHILTERPGDMIHAGTFFGDMLPSFAKACPGTVHAFEPVLESYVLARMCVEANNLRNVRLMHAALGDTSGIVHMQTSIPGHAHLGGASHVAEAGQQVTQIAIDMLALDNVSILQLDIEGREKAALTGAGDTIARCRPVIMVEDNAGDCRPVLWGFGYVKVRTIPGLQIWTPRDQRDLIPAPPKAGDTA